MELKNAPGWLAALAIVSHAIVCTTFILAVAATWGDPDIIDALVSRLMCP
jgi:hypothetical protein